MSIITATAWVPRGYAAEYPTKFVDDEEENEQEEPAAVAMEEEEDDEEEEEDDENDNDNAMDQDHDTKENKETSSPTIKLQRTAEEEDDDLREYDLENYDNSASDSDSDREILSSGGGGGATAYLSTMGNPRALAYHASNADDPYLSRHDGAAGSDSDSEAEERDELRILGDDNMVLAARVQDEVAHMEVYVYEDEAANLYVHHDFMLPAIPLCIEWLDVGIGGEQEKRNFVAVGTFEPDIEIWDLDTVDRMDPSAVLGAPLEKKGDGDGKQKKKGKKNRVKKSNKVNDQYHVDAVLGLAANKNHRTLLASASADKTIKLWDLNTTKCAKSYSHHTDKVCSIEWSPKDTTVLLSGSYDRSAVVADMRAPEAKAPRWSVESDVESVRWNIHDPDYFFITTENGIVHYYDVRTAPSTSSTSKVPKPVWKLQAHDAAVSSFDINPAIPGFLATGSTDKQVKLWNVQDNAPRLVVSRNVDVGRVFSTRFAPDPEVAFRLAVAGSRGSLQIWDTSTNAAVRRIFAHRIKDGEVPVKERLVGLQNDVGESSGDEAAADGKDGWESMDED